MQFYFFDKTQTKQLIYMCHKIERTAMHHKITSNKHNEKLEFSSHLKTITIISNITKNKPNKNKHEKKGDYVPNEESMMPKKQMMVI